MAESEVSQRVDWWRVITDLSCKGMTMEAISSSASVPLSTLAGYKNLNVEPKMANGCCRFGARNVRRPCL